MNIINIEHISKLFGDKLIFDDASFGLQEGDKVGIVGINGTGKSTLLRLFAGELSPDSGTVDIGTTVKIGHFSQEGRELDLNQRVYDFIHDIGDEVRTDEGTFTAKAMMERFLFPSDLQSVPIGRLSGGERRRLYLLSILMEAPNVLLLDEPTNHLDLQATEWLEEYLRKFHGTVVAISHDRYFLDRTVSRVIEVLDGKAEFYSGNYSFYAVEKERRYQERMKQYEKEQAKIAQLEKSAEQLRMWAFQGMDKTYRRAISMERPIERMRTTAKPTKARKMDARFTAAEFHGDEVLGIRNLSKAYGEKPLFEGISLKVEGGERIALIGENGTGKTTLSTDPKRLLIGDDEHGWDDNGVFNFEGGCYAKVINLDKESEPDIYNAIKRNALLENVTLDENGKIDFADKSVTENTRVSYPIDHIKNIVRPISSAPAAKNVIFLSADAFGVLPPVSILTPEQTKYYFLSGFTAKLAGTERGITEPTPTFSACFGQAFLELHPTKYAEELVKRMEMSGAKAYLVNTGWNGTGKRISIKDTRGIIDAILNGDILGVPTNKIPYFDFEVPTELKGVDTNILDPRDTYANPADWDAKAKDLASRFIKNFAKYEGNEAGKALVDASPKVD